MWIWSACKGWESIFAGFADAKQQCSVALLFALLERFRYNAIESHRITQTTKPTILIPGIQIGGECRVAAAKKKAAAKKPVKKAASASKKKK